MPRFANADEVNAIIGRAVSDLAHSPGFAPRLLRIDRTIQLDLTEPTAKIAMRFRKGLSMKVDLGRTSMAPDTVVGMSADTAHRLFLGELNIFLAIDRGDVSIDGPAEEFLASLPYMRRWVAPLYRRIAETNGRFEPADPIVSARIAA
jgi:SCP-2 sterol transfer family